mmetsp:Transcript_26240/g.30085  ORF Transcript_26240/g.30085 Transcript_26240/m.30085 type:complete len:171 (+) Transcript_26240:2364-2876(+)
MDKSRTDQPRSLIQRLPLNGAKGKSRRITKGGDKSLLFRCGLCGYSHRNEVMVQRHVSSHLVSRPLACDLCRQQFNSVYHLREHNLLHCWKTLLCCPLRSCGKKFRHHSRYIQHCRGHGYTFGKNSTPSKGELAKEIRGDLMAKVVRDFDLNFFLCNFIAIMSPDNGQLN